MDRGRLLAACIGLLLSVFSWNTGANDAGYLDFDNLPETNFSCEGKVIGGYYADTETGCQMFHVCTIGQKGEITDIKFLCLNGTVFDQETRVCERLDEVDCSKSESFYDLNLELYGNNGAGYGIQPENEVNEETILCQEEDEEDCETEKPPSSVKLSPTEQAQSSGDESGEEQTTMQQPITSSTTTRRPIVVTTNFPSTTATPQILQFPTSSPESIAALLALHKAFSQSLRQHSNNKDSKINPTKITGFVEKHNPITSTQDAEIFEIKPGLDQQITTFSSKSPTPNNAHNPSKIQYQSSPRPQYQQNQPNLQYQNRETQKQPYQNLPKPPPIRLPPTFSKPTHTTSQSFGNLPFHNSFHLSSQYSDQNYHDSYTDPDSQHSSQPLNEPLKQYDYEDDYYDEKPHSSTVTPYILHQLKVNQVQNNNKAKVVSAEQGSFRREVTNSNTPKNFINPSFRSITTPGLAIITATSTTSSSSIKTSKQLPSAIQSLKDKSVPIFVDSLLNNPTENITIQLPLPPQSYDDYREGDVRSDPFYKDVPKINRNKRSPINSSIRNDKWSFLDDVVLTYLKNNLTDSVYTDISDSVMHILVGYYCKYSINSSDTLDSICGHTYSTSNVSDDSIGGRWEIIAPTQDEDHFLLVKTIISYNKSQNHTKTVLLVLYIPQRIRKIKDSYFKRLTKLKSKVIFKNINHANKFSQIFQINASLFNNKSPSKYNITNRIFDQNMTFISNKDRIENPLQYSYHSNISLMNQLNVNKIAVLLGSIASQNNIENNKNISSINQLLMKHSYQMARRMKRQVPSSDSNVDLRVINRNTNQNIHPSSRRRVQIPIEQTGDRSDMSIRNERKRIAVRKRRPTQRVETNLSQITQTPDQLETYRRVKDPVPTFSSQEPLKQQPLKGFDDLTPGNKNLGQPLTSRRRGQGRKYHFSESVQTENTAVESESGDLEVSTTYPFNLKPGVKFNCDNKIKGGYYADVEAECYGYFICSQGEVNGPLLKSHFWCGPTTKFNQRSRTCQIEANVACAVSERYFHLNKDILSLPDPIEEVKDSFEPSKIPS